MKPADVVRLLVLAAIWGGSFIFMRALAPILGPVLTAELRVLIGGLSLVVYFLAVGFSLDWRQSWLQYLVIGGINCAIPFFLFSFAALHIPGSFSAILNSSSPLFGAIFSAIWLSDRLTFRKIIGLLIGAFGVGLVVKIGAVQTDSMFGWAVTACTVAAVCYGIAATYIKKSCSHLKSKGIAAGSQIMAAALLLPAIPFSPATGSVTLWVAVAVFFFGLLCSGIAYLLYYRLIADVGPTKALTVTFLMPVFGMIWGVTFLKETVTLSMICGAALIILGSGLVLNVFAGRRQKTATVERPKDVVAQDRI